GVVTARFLVDDPFESNFRNLRSHNDDIDEAQGWMTKIDRAFGRGIDGGFVIALARASDAASLEAKLRAIDAGKPEAQRLFADNVRALDLPPDAHLGGAWFVFADVLDAVITDGPRATLAAALGAALVVLLVLGWNRYAFVTLVCGASGTLLMLGSAALFGFKVNFLDFVALPITIGIGIEYAVNIVTRARQDSAAAALASTGGAVFLCSYTTIVGYGSLLLSQNLGIRSFGLAAMLGEVTCLSVALLLAPALLTLMRGTPAQPPRA